VELGVPLDDTIRLITANSQPLKVRVSGKIIYDEDGTPMLNIIFIASSKKMQSYDDLLNYTTHAIYISDADTYEMLYLNRTGAKLFGQEGESYLGKKCYEVLYGYKSPCQFCKVEKMSDEKFLERDSYSAMLGKTFHLWGKLLKWENATAHVEYMEDVSEARRISNQNANLTKQLSMVIENIPSAMGLYRFDGSKVSLVTYNQAFFELMGYSEKNMNAAKNGDTMINIHPEDALTLMEKSKDGIFRSRTLKHTYRVFSDAKGQYIWVKLNGLVVPELDGTKLCYITYVDVSEERNALEKLGETSGLLQAALHSANVAVGEIEVENNRLIRLKSSRDSANSELIIENMPESVIEKGYIHQDSVEDFRELYRQMYRGENCQKDIMVTTKGRADAWWERIIFTPVFNSNGVFTKAISTSMDVSEQKKLEAIYKELETIRAETADGLMLNISKNKVDSMYSTSDVFISLNTGDVDDFLKNTLNNIPTAEKRREFLAIYTRPALLRAYSLGKTVLSLETLYNVGEKGKDVYRYSELNLRLTKHPYTGDIMGYAYLLDVHDRHTMQTVVDKIVSQDFSFIMLLDMEKNSTKLISGKMSVYKEQESNITYDQSIIKFFDKYVVEEDRER
ncbi:MAG: PAS domain-containing protein, partial [Oscillospiraceae bacterium]